MKLLFVQALRLSILLGFFTLPVVAEGLSENNRKGTLLVMAG